MILTNKQTKKIYSLSEKQNQFRLSIFDLIKGSKGLKKQKKLLNKFESFLNIENIDRKDLKLALIERLVTLRDTTLKSVLKQNEYSEDDINIVQEKCYTFVSNYYEKEHLKLKNRILNIKNLNPSTRIIFNTWFNVGIEMTQLHLEWEEQILKNINPELEKRFGSVENVITYLTNNNLMDLGHNNEIADRMYSVLVKVGNGYKSLSYKDAFTININNIVKILSNGHNSLKEQSDSSVKINDNWCKYFASLINAFNETNVNLLVSKWAEVDKVWMNIDSPIQPGHFFEYYEDKYRKAVAIEWDMRIDDLSLPKNKRSKTIQTLFDDEYSKFVQKECPIFKHETSNFNEYEDIKKEVNNNIEKVQLHIGKPLFYFASSFNGLFSAQVIPNDEIVSGEYGKKIFAFPDKKSETARKKPFLKMERKIFGDKIVDLSRRNIFKTPERDLKVYDITTIGHEYGHVLWKDQDAEIVMNESGNFKNIEEFKATSGGLMAFFDSEEEEEYRMDVFADVIKREISLIALKEESDIEPYYCESLIVLDILVQSEVINIEKNIEVFNGDTSIDFSIESYERFKINLKKVYYDLINVYMKKENSNNFLFNYVNHDGKHFQPRDENIKRFTDWYYKYQQENCSILEENNTNV